MITTASPSSTTNAGAFAGSSFTYTYDRYGNRTAQTASAGSGPRPQFSVSSPANQFSGYTYDAAGNMTNDGFHSYTYDAEGNILTVDGGSTAAYVYDALNRRVRVGTSSATTYYLFDYAGRRISSWLNPSPGNPGTGDEGRIYWGRKQIAFRAADGTTYFEHKDWTGTERLRTNYTGAAAPSYSSLPWGDGSTPAVDGLNAAQDNAFFAGTDFDPESGTDHAQFRNYSPTLGRWLAPDPYDGSYNFANPQSFNRYAYVLNNPSGATDPSGLCEYCGGSGGDWYDDALSEDWSNIASDTRSENIFGAQVGNLLMDSVDHRYMGPEQLSFDGPGNPSETIYVGCNGPDIFTFTCSPTGPYWTLLASGWSPYMTDSYRILALSQQISAQAGWVGSPKGIAAWYGISALGASPAMAASVAELPTMSVAVGEGLPFHVAYGANGTWVNGVGDFFAMQVSRYAAEETAATAWYTFQVPVLSTEGVAATGQAAWFCFTACTSAFGRAWIP